MEGHHLIIRHIDLPPRDLAAIASRFSDQGGVALLAGVSDRVNVVLMSGNERVNAGEIIGKICILLGGKGGGSKTMAQGGGPDMGQLDLALKVGREQIMAALK